MIARLAPPLRAVGLVMLCAAAVSTPALAGPPWISIEIPVNPFDTATRDAFLIVHTYHHAQIAQQALVGTAEGIVDGQRRSVQLEFTPTAREGVFALRKLWPSQGTWVLVITVMAHEVGGATALVRLGEDGEVASVLVPTERRGGWTIPRKVTADEVDGLLKARADAPQDSTSQMRPARGS